jgi:citrate lyase subunit beta / citryl-CoA lyase
MLFVPGNRTPWVAKGAAAGADAVILDLEDAVPGSAKAEARAEVAEYLRSAPVTGEATLLFVRINGLHSRDALDDLAAVVGPALAGVLVPKVESAADVQLVDRLLGWLEADRGLGHRVSIVPVLETAAGIRQAFELASASERTAYMGGLAVKGGDVERSLGYQWTSAGTETLAMRSQVLIDVRAAAAPNPVTGMWSEIRDIDGLTDFAQHSRHLGYEGMLAIHPSHLECINAAFTPSQQQLDADAALIEAVENAARDGRGAVVYDGQMVDEAMAATARARLDRYRG